MLIAHLVIAYAIPCVITSPVCVRAATGEIADVRFSVSHCLFRSALLNLFCLVLVSLNAKDLQCAEFLYINLVKSNLDAHCQREIEVKPSRYRGLFGNCLVEPVEFAFETPLATYQQIILVPNLNNVRTSDTGS